LTFALPRGHVAACHSATGIECILLFSHDNLGGMFLPMHGQQWHMTDGCGHFTAWLVVLLACLRHHYTDAEGTAGAGQPM
jgi:hypothetical protein